MPRVVLVLDDIAIACRSVREAIEVLESCETSSLDVLRRLRERDEPRQPDPLMLALRRYAIEFGLRPSEIRILSAALAGTARAALADALDVSENTIKTQIRLLLARTDEDTLETVVHRVLAAAASLRGITRA